MTISLRLQDLAPYYRLVKSAAAAGARSVADWIGARPQPSVPAATAAPDATSIAVQQGYVRGWIVDTAGTERKPLRVFLDGKLIGVVTADLPLPKIDQRFALPTVRYGFRFPVPPAARDGASHTVAVQTLDKRTRRTIRFVAPHYGDSPRIELLAVSENGVRGVLLNGYDAAEGPELWVGDRKLVWPAAVARLTPREDLATVFEIDLPKLELGALLGQGLRLALPGGRDVGMTTSLVDLLGVRFARPGPETLRVTTRVAIPRLHGVAFQIELSADADFTGATHRAAFSLSAAAADVASPASLAGRALWARLVLVAARDRTASAARYVPADGKVSRPLYAFDPATAGEPQIWRDPPSGAEMVQGAYVQYDASTSETCAISLSAPSDDRPATLTCDASTGGAGVRLCFPVPLGTTQAGDRITLAFAARSRPDGARGVAFRLMPSRGPTLAKAFEATLDLPAPEPCGWMRRDVALVLGECARNDFLDLIVEIEPGAGVEIASVLAEVVAGLGTEAPGDGRKIRMETAPRTVGAVWFDGKAIVGWAVDEANPRRPVTVEITVDGQPAERVTATDLHPVLIGREHNYGRCAFRITASAALRDGERHVVEARMLDGAVLPGSPMTVRMAPLGSARPLNEAQRLIAAGDHARADRFVALRTAATTPGERRDVLERETEALRVPALPRRPVTAAIKISAPTLATAQGWGDFHFANALRAALQRVGWVVRVDCRDEWEQTGGDEVTLTLRGRHRYRGAAEALNLLWVISHPDRLTPQETADYAHVFVASDIFANMLRTRTATPISVLHQATDPAVFHPPEEPVAVTAPALFVGNSRREYRAMVRWCVEAGIDLHVFGQLWNGLIPDRMILGEHVANADLHRWYGATPILLNDHWDTMRAMGFLSNRLFDGSAVGAFIITDPVRGLAPVFGDAIETAADAAELKDKVAFYLAHPEEAREKAERARAIVLAGHTFDDRARTIVAVCEAAAARRSAP